LITFTGIDEDLEGFQPAMMSFKSFMQTQVSLSSASLLKGLFKEFEGLLYLVWYEVQWALTASEFSCSFDFSAKKMHMISF
jgi:hypothetical protein